MNDGDTDKWGRTLRFELRRGPDIIAYLLYYAFSVSNADCKIALIDEAEMRRALAHLVAAAVGEVTDRYQEVLYRPGSGRRLELF
jgi:hypothetical protein